LSAPLGTFAAPARKVMHRWGALRVSDDYVCRHLLAPSRHLHEK
jgi:hypothetical protein